MDTKQAIKDAVSLMNEAFADEPDLNGCKVETGAATKIVGVDLGDNAVMILDWFIIDRGNGTQLANCNAVFLNRGGQYTRIFVEGWDTSDRDEDELVQFDLIHDGGS